MQVNYVFPLWSIIMTLICIILPVVWSLIKMYFKQIALSEKIKAVENKALSQDNAIIHFKKDIEDKLDRHKFATDTKLGELNNIMVEVNTMTKLLVGDKIKK